MKNPISGAVLTIGMAICLCASASRPQHRVDDGRSKQPIRVLYVASTAGDADPDRPADFRSFLERRFKSVEVVKDAEFTPAVAEDRDVLIIDGDIHDRVGSEFLRPMILLGADFGPIRFAETHGYKLRNSCRVQTEKFHTVRTDHAIFRGPMPVSPTLVDDLDPYTGRTVRAWRLHEPYSPPRFRYHFAKGMTVARSLLLHAEDSEIIAGGVNTQGDANSVAMAREANLFLWGSPASPRHMTPEARKVFVNTIVYMAQFDGVAPTVRRGAKPRSRIVWALDRAEDYRSKGHHAFAERELASVFPADVVERNGLDIELYRATYAGNLDYVYVPQGMATFSVDDDVKALGVPNRDVRLLERSIEALQNPAEDERARRLLERYTDLSFTETEAWQKWLERSRGELYFSDYYGYRFYDGAAGPAPAPKDVQRAIWEMETPLPGYFAASVDAVAVGMAVSQPGQTLDDKGEPVDLVHEPGAYVANKGGIVTLVVRLNIGDYVYAPATCPAGDEGCEVARIDVDLPEGARWHGDWSRPEVYEGTRIATSAYRGDTVFKRQLYFTSVPEEGRDRLGRAVVRIPGSVRYQLCSQTDAETDRCNDPVETSFEVPLVLWDR